LDRWLTLTIIQGLSKPAQSSLGQGDQSKFGSTETQ
jgi:hypothetical protein